MAQNAQDIAVSNQVNRINLLSTGLHMVKQLQPVSGALGAQIRIPLERVGIMTGIMLDVTVPVNVTVAATRSQMGPYNIFNNIRYTDYAGVDRVNTHGFLLHALNNFKTGQLVNNAQPGSGYISSELGLNTNILRHPTAVAADNMSFSIYVPIAYDPASDLRGAVLSQTIYGDHYVTIQLPTALVGTDPLMFPYTAGTVALQAGTSITVQAYQHYIMPQQGVENLPMIDLSTIYAVEGNYNDSANINAGQAKFVNWPNNRSILSAMHFFNQAATGGTLNEADVSRLILLGNSSTNIREYSPRYIRNQMRFALGADMASGLYYLPTRSQPITTQLYGNVQSRFDITTAGAGSYFLSQYESTYLAGTPLPGVIQ